MNARSNMTHSFIAVETSKAAEINNAKTEGELSAVLVDQLRRAPTLNTATRAMLADALRNVMQFPNPDAIFIHGSTFDQTAHEPLSLTQMTFRAVTGDTSYMDDVDAVVSSRPDSALVEHHIPGCSMQNVRDMLSKVLPKIAGFLKFLLDEFWEHDEPTFDAIPGEGSVTGTRVDIFRAVLKRLFSHSIAFAAYSRVLNTQDEQRLHDAVDSHSADGIFSLSLQTGDGSSLPLAGTFVVSAQGQRALSSSGNDAGAEPVFLYTPAWGVERFDTLTSMDAALAQRLGQEDSRELLLGYMHLEHQVFTTQTADESLRPHYRPLDIAPADYLIEGMRQKQLDDIDYLLSQRASKDQDPRQLSEMFDDASHLDDLTDALGTRYQSILAFVQKRSEPDWLKFAEPSDRQRYDQLQSEQTRLQAVVQQRLVGVESDELYARDRIAKYMTHHLGYTLDPALVMVNMPDPIQVASATVQASYRHSLLHVAMEGMPSVDLTNGPGVDVDPAYASTRLDFDFVARLVLKLDLKLQYGREVETRYRHPEMVQAMSALRTSEIALSAWSAKLQGHVSERGLNLIDRIQGQASDAALSVGALYLTGSKRKLEDAIVLRELSDQGEYYVMFVPGLPGDREVFSFDSWRKLSFEVGGWTGDAQRAQYLLDQTVMDGNQPVVPYLESIRQKPSDWSVESVQFVRVEGAVFSNAVTRCVEYKIEQVLDRNDFVSAIRMQHVTPAHRAAKVGLDYRIAALKHAYSAHQITPWREAARKECERLIAHHLKTSGVAGRIDPDTVYCDLDGQTVNGEPDFGRYSTLKSLTQLFMAGYSQEEYLFHPQAELYSTIGQDLSGLSALFIDQMIRGSNFADEYVGQLRKHTAGLTNTPPREARALYSRIKNHEMRRDALIEFQKGRVTEPQYNWLVMMCAGLDGSASMAKPFIPGTFHQLSLERKIIGDIGIFKPDGHNAHLAALAYTPDAPDGWLFRREADIVTSVSRPGMTQYYYDRATYKSQRIIGTLLSKLELSPIVNGKPYRIGYSDPIKDLQNLHASNVHHLIIDIDSQTESVNERRLLNTYNFVRDYGGYVVKLHPVSAAVWHAFHATVDLFRGIYAHQDGDRAKARDFYISAAKEAFKTFKLVRKIRKKEKLKRLQQVQARNPASRMLWL